MTNKLMIAMMTVAMGWIGNEALAQETDSTDPWGTDTQVETQPDKGVENGANKQRGDRAERGQRGQRGQKGSDRIQRPGFSSPPGRLRGST